mgnify:CR=1 FL=1
MKRTFILLMSAAALIVVFTILAHAWSASSKSPYDFYGRQWGCADSPHVTATAGTGYCIAVAGWSELNCSGRSAEAKRASNFSIVAQSFCPNYDSQTQQTPDCCVKDTWQAEAIDYLVQSCQSSNNPANCPAVTGIIQGTNYLCAQQGPGGP